MSDNSTLFKVGDKVITKVGGCEGVVVFIFDGDKQNNLNYGLLIEFPTWAGRLCAKDLSLVPDPMVARREAYITFTSIVWPEWSAERKQAVREGRLDKQVNQYYDAIVATKHLFV